jgi:hypothetical protein
MDNLTQVNMEIKEDLKNLMETRNINEFLMVSVFES